MSKNFKILIFGILFLMLIIPLVCASSYEQGENIILKVSCADLTNCSNAQNITISSPNSSIIVDNQEMTITNGYAQFTLSYTNDVGSYQYFIYDLSDGYYTNSFDVTPNGEIATVGKSIFYIGLLTILLFFFLLSIIGFVVFESIISKVGLFGLSYLLGIAITFICWNMANDFLVSSIFIIGMFKILFYVLIIGLFPLVVGSFAYYFYMITKIKEIERLMTKGLNFGEAERRTGRKFK